MGPTMKRSFFLLSILVSVSMLLSACGGGQASPAAPVDQGPTVDPNLVFTSGAQTVVAQITLDAANRPVPSAAIPATPTLEMTVDPAAPTADPNAIPAIPLAPGITPGAAVPTTAPLAGAVVTQPSASLATPASIAPAATLPAAASAVTSVPAVPDKLQWVSNVPSDKSKVPAGKGFKITWKLQNIGTTTWDKTYTFKFFAGTQLAKNSAYSIVKDVKPNTSMDFTVDAVAPSAPGDYYSLWVLQRPDGINVGKFDITLTVQ